ncbi:hypothetical protein SAMN05428975_4810 [Mucilaginibacter sp. OK268]|nr:hypothetical protein SAMN05428975_4810 [Mucilaginibacter sp. OK268]
MCLLINVNVYGGVVWKGDVSVNGCFVPIDTVFYLDFIQLRMIS